MSSNNKLVEDTIGRILTDMRGDRPLVLEPYLKDLETAERRRVLMSMANYGVRMDQTDTTYQAISLLGFRNE